MNSSAVQIGCSSVKELFSTQEKIFIPAYQRPYTWSRTQIADLLADLQEHFFVNETFSENVTEYYLGMVLLYRDEKGNCYEIIDGQQRITTMLILDFICNPNNAFLNNKGWNLTYKSRISAQNIKRAQQEISAYEKLKQLNENWQRILEKTVITVLICDDKDLAFTFFDSQNNRGVKLSSVDFLKSYHLRALKDDLNLQKLFAKQWDLQNTNDFLQELFSLQLWRTRTWKGKYLDYENNADIVEHFQKKMLNNQTLYEVSLYPNKANRLGNTLKFTADDGVSLVSQPIALQLKAADYPFSVRQPLEKGVSFFLYTEKYAALYKKLFYEFAYPEVKEVYNRLILGFNYYFHSFFKLLVLNYYDKFGNFRMKEFMLLVDYLLGSYRFNQATIIRQTVIKILRDQSQNILDVIEMAYRPEDVFDFIKRITDKNHYQQRDLGTENGVRSMYLKRNLDYYEKEEGADITQKLQWIYDKLQK